LEFETEVAALDNFSLEVDTDRRNMRIPKITAVKTTKNTRFPNGGVADRQNLWCEKRGKLKKASLVSEGQRKHFVSHWNHIRWPNRGINERGLQK
jgi:hypothetical protein